MKSAHALFVGLRARAKVGILIEAIAVLALAFTGFAALSYAIDRTLHLERPFRAGLLLLFVGVALRLIWLRALRPLMVEISDDEFALAVERRDPTLHARLISAVQFDRDLRHDTLQGQSAAMMRTVVESVEGQLAELGLHRALDGRRVLGFVGWFFVAFTLLATWTGLAATESRLWAQRNLWLSDTPWPRDTYLRFLDVEPGLPIRLAEREDLVVRVRADGVVPDTVLLESRFASGEFTSRPMDRTGDDEFSARLEAVLDDLELVARGGDGSTEVLRVMLVPRPLITDLSVTVLRPAYLDEEPLVIDPSGGEIRVVRGSRLTITAQASKPLQTAALRIGQDQREAVPLDAARTALRVELTLERSATLTLDVLDDDALGPLLPPQLVVRLADDLPPVLDFESRGVGRLITANARIPGVLRLSDDFGVIAVRGYYRHVDVELEIDADHDAAPDQAFLAAPIDWGGELEVGSPSQDLPLVFDLLPMQVEADPDAAGNPIHPGQLLSLRFEADDAQRPTPGTGESDVLNFRVVTRETLHQDLRRRQLEQRRELELVLERVIETRGVIAEIVSPEGDEPRAVQARIRVETLSRRQIALGKKTQVIADRYAQILDEQVNNRLFEAAVTRGLATRIVSPLSSLASDAFPTSAERGFAFAATGSDSTRASTVASYDAIVAAIQRVLEQMERSEDIAAIAAALRIVIRTGEQAEQLVEELRDRSGADIFGTAPGTADPDKDGGSNPSGAEDVNLPRATGRGH